MSKTALALGTFDGVHLGHRAVIEAAVKSGFKPIAVVFKFPPKMHFDKNVGCLTTLKDKDTQIRNLGVEQIHYLDFPDIKDMSAWEFLEHLRDQLNPTYICCGFNYHFGKNAAGNTAMLKEFCEQNGIILKVLDPICVDEQIISSTYVRSLLRSGNVEEANKLLADNFGFCAEVIKGDERGRTLGFPTANQQYPDELIDVKHGVYKSLVTVNGKTYNGITNIGYRPTFKTEQVGSETYILDFYGDIYGVPTDVRLIKYLREEQKFDSIEQLKDAIKKDIEK